MWCCSGGGWESRANWRQRAAASWARCQWRSYAIWRTGRPIRVHHWYHSHRLRCCCPLRRCCCFLPGTPRSRCSSGARIEQIGQIVQRLELCKSPTHTRTQTGTVAHTHTHKLYTNWPRLSTPNCVYRSTVSHRTPHTLLARKKVAVKICFVFFAFRLVSPRILLIICCNFWLLFYFYFCRIPAWQVGLCVWEAEARQRQRRQKIVGVRCVVRAGAKVTSVWRCASTRTAIPLFSSSVFSLEAEPSQASKHVSGSSSSSSSLLWRAFHGGAGYDACACYKQSTNWHAPRLSAELAASASPFCCVAIRSPPDVAFPMHIKLAQLGTFE